MIKLKAKTLEDLINKELRTLPSSFYESTMFAIHEEDGMQVRVEITQDEDEFTDKLYAKYTDA